VIREVEAIERLGSEIVIAQADVTSQKQMHETVEMIRRFGAPRHPEPEGEERQAFTGKIAGLIFDRFGDFEGFLLDTEDGERRFFSREKEIEALAERAWRDRLRITVWVERHEPHRPLSIIIRQPLASFRR